jgi:transposase
MVERARLILACLEGKEIQQVAQQTGASIPTVSKWRKRFAREGIRGLRDQPRFATACWRYWNKHRLPA